MPMETSVGRVCEATTRHVIHTPCETLSKGNNVYAAHIPEQDGWLPSGLPLYAAITGLFITSLSVLSQGSWDSFEARHGLQSLMILGTFIITTILYWGLALFMARFDLDPVLHEAAQSQKLQPDKLPTKSDFVKAGKVVLFNMVVVNLPMGVLFTRVYLWRVSGVLARLPAFWNVICDLLIFMGLEEIGFYYFHRLMHHPLLYRRIHKQHHEFTAPMGLAAIYAHPIEHALVNLTPLFVGPVILGSHPLVCWFWFALATINTVNSHGGYVRMAWPSPLQHDFHHYQFTDNFGILGILDRLHGTDKRFQTYLKRRRALNT